MKLPTCTLAIVWRRAPNAPEPHQQTFRHAKMDIRNSF
jgi:hypothetical protein